VPAREAAAVLAEDERLRLVRGVDRVGRVADQALDRRRAGSP
jgi:hypothetical protein